MAKIVIKFGGTSVGSVDRIIAAAKIIKKNLIEATKLQLLFQQWPVKPMN